MKNYGLKNEIDFKNSIDGKNFDELTPFIQTNFKRTIKNIDYEGTFRCNISNKVSKTDITVWNQNKPSYFGIKYGTSDSFHFEEAKAFILFFRKLGLSIKSQKTLFNYLNGDGTLNGTGKTVLSFKTNCKKYKKQIDGLNNELFSKNLINDIKRIIDESKKSVARNVNLIMIQTYWNIGKRIVEEEQNGKERAKYGTSLLKYLSKELSTNYGKGFSRSNLQSMRNFISNIKNAKHCLAN